MKWWERKRGKRLKREDIPARFAPGATKEPGFKVEVTLAVSEQNQTAAYTLLRLHFPVWLKDVMADEKLSRDVKVQLGKRISREFDACVRQLCKIKAMTR